MRTSLVLAVTLPFASAAHAQRRTAPCTTPTTPCERWVTLGGGPGRSMVYATYSLDAPNAAITRAFILVHGTNRNADHYFATATAAAFLTGAVAVAK